MRLPWDWFPASGALLLLYFFLNLALPRVKPGPFAAYVVQPAAWGTLALIILCLPPQRSRGTARLRRLAVKLALCVAVCQVYLAFSAGFLTGFGKNPAAFTPGVMLVNFMLLGVHLVGMELSRSWLINRAGRRAGTWWIAGVALLYTFLPLPWNQLPDLQNGFGVLARFCAGDFLPLFMESLTASFLSAWGGAPAALVYRGLPALFSWFCPVLPDTDWVFKALTGTLAPAVGLGIAADFLVTKKGHSGRWRRGGTAGWVVLSAGLLVITWFALGLFPIRPMVIQGGSMRPALAEGDIVVVAKANPQRLKAGQVIAYRRREGPGIVVHRLTAIRSEDNRAFFIAKGDAAEQPDSVPVRPEEVVGRVVLVIPKAGWITLLGRRLFA